MNRSIFFIVKGAPEAAVAAAASRGIEAHCVGTNTYQNTYLRSASSAYERAQRWFHEDMGRTAPFPEGSLLWFAYSPTEVGDAPGN
jgi:hypothetical protein